MDDHVKSMNKIAKKIKIIRLSVRFSKALKGLLDRVRNQKKALVSDPNFTKDFCFVGDRNQLVSNYSKG